MIPKCSNNIFTPINIRIKPPTVSAFLSYISPNLLPILTPIIDIPKETFLPHTPTKTTVLVVQKYRKTEQSLQDYPVFMAVCETCGHDRRGNLTEDDDILNVASNFKKWREKNGIQF